MKKMKISFLGFGEIWGGRGGLVRENFVLINSMSQSINSLTPESLGVWNKDIDLKSSYMIIGSLMP